MPVYLSVISDEACFGLFLLGKGLVCVNLKGAYTLSSQSLIQGQIAYAVSGPRDC
jgi:hypothetical protein